MGIIHETGHGLYEQHLPQELKYWPSGAARGMAIHESQSLFFEMQVGMSPEFLGLISPFIKEFLGGESNVSELTAEDIYENVAQVGPSYIRVEADEVTYPCHVILRYEIERMLFSGEAKVKDIPAIWNEKMKQYLGLSTEGNFKDGCMQDVHWPAGIFGYFPSYTLGAVLAAQLFSAMESSIGNVRQKISKGQFEEIRSWLDRNIWKVASQKSIDEVIKDATGSSLQVTAFQNHLTNRYLK
jgi:carboxypeptidase Taq